MAIRIPDLLDDTILHILRSHHDPGDIQTKNVAESAKVLLKAIGAIDTLPEWQPFLQRFSTVQQLYPDIFSHRTNYLWQWIQVAFEITGLNISSKYAALIHSLKCCSAFAIYLIDDICDTTLDENCLEKSIAALSGEISDSEYDLHTLIYDTWSIAQNDIQKAPNYNLLKEDLVKANECQIDGFRYCLTIEDYSEIDWETYIETLPHTTHVYLAGLIDLLYIPNILKSQVKLLKKIFLLTQKMAQIGNWVTTWEREVDKRDYSSGVIIFAIKNGWIDINDIEEHRAEAIKRDVKQSPAGKHILRLWEECREECCQLSKQLNMPFIDEYINSFSIIIFMQLASVGLT